MGQKGAMQNGARGVSADSGTECLAKPNPNMVWNWVSPKNLSSLLQKFS